ncbi:MAG: hypothetical protein NXI00_07260 [Cytophagales bacterium]|nr:hypothetical protein [Cytophagales bacterium]
MSVSSFKMTFLFIFFSILTGCQSKITDERLGLYIDYKGIKPKTVRVLQNQQIKTDKNIGFANFLTIEILGIDSFEKLSSGKVLPGAEYAVVDEKQNIIYITKDLFTKYGLIGVPEKDAASLKLNLTIGKPMEVGKKYFFLFRIWDKNSDKELKGNLELNVQ